MNPLNDNATPVTARWWQVRLISLVALGAIILPLSGMAGAATTTGGMAIAPDIRFGAVEALQAPTRATEAGVRWERLPFIWSAIQVRGQLDWHDPYSTKVLTDESSRGRAIAGVISGTPSWAANEPGQGGVSVPRGLDTPYDDPRNTWGTFVGRLVQRYRGLVKTWFIWNEPDRNAGSVQHTWAGSVAAYYLLLKTAYLAAKANDPGCQVVVGGLTYWWDKENNRPQFLETLLQQATADPTAATNHSYFDGVGAHVYNSPLNSLTVPLVFGRILAAHGLTKPIWIDETNVAPYDDPTGTLSALPFRASLADQASYIVQSYAMALAAGVRRISVYRMVDDTTGGDAPDHFGLLRLDGTVRPAYAAFQTVTSVFGGTSSAYYTWHDDGSAPSQSEIDTLLASNTSRVEWVWPAAINRVVLRQADRQVTVLWNAAPASMAVSLPVGGRDAVVIDKMGGRTTPVVGADGRYHLMLDGATDNNDPRDRSLYLVGGSPLVLQESGITASATPPAAQDTALPSPSSSLPVASPTPPVSVTSSAPPPSPTAPSLAAGARGLAAPVAPLPLSAHALFFAATAHNIAGAFRSIFTAYGGVATLGYPRTEAVISGTQLVQYFQNLELVCTRLCRDPAFTATVSLAPLGADALSLAPPQPPAARSVGWGDSMYFATTSHNLSGPFLEYWQAHNGAALLGAPLSEPLAQVAQQGTPQAYTLQYFQYGALAYRPTGRGGQFAVRPEPLGDNLLRARGWLP